VSVARVPEAANGAASSLLIWRKVRRAGRPQTADGEVAFVAGDLEIYDDSRRGVSGMAAAQRLGRFSRAFAELFSSSTMSVSRGCWSLRDAVEIRDCVLRAASAVPILSSF